MILLADPFTTDIGGLLAGINDTAPGWSVFGGMVSGAEAPGQAALIANGSTYRDGIVGVALNDRVLVNPVVSQGCRPIGKPYIVTKADRRIIYQLGGQNPLRVLEQIFEAATPEERSLMRQGVLVGQAIKETQPEFRRGDFLIRHLHNAHPGSGAIGVSDAMRVGVTVQFHVRDAASADEDLRALVNGSQGPERPSGALLFSGNGRGTRLFPGLESHDVGVLRELVPDLPVAGFTCAGELGPLGGKNFIHGQTASIAFFRSRNDGPIPAS
ncbi:MAG TPA: FIST N-terminal domain-containing protein [Gemmatales bacterium]|nr:FIST N-terminal domain-containing protein [Gemmatales bacterium]